MSVTNVLGIASGALGAANLAKSVFGIDDSSKQMKNQKELMDYQQEQNKEMMDYASNIQKDMYEYTGYGSKVRQMKEAGLNPALMYGDAAGSGGVTGSNSAVGVSGAAAPNEASFKANKIAAAGMGLQLAKLESEIAVNKSVENLNNTEAIKKSGADTNLTNTQIQSLEQGIKLMAEQTSNEAVKREGMDIANDIARIQRNIQSATQDESVQQIEYTTRQMKYSIDKIIAETANTKADTAAVYKTVELYNNEIKRIAAEILEINSSNQLNKDKSNEIINSIAQNWEKLVLENQGQEIDVQRILADLEMNLKNNRTEIKKTVINSVSNILGGLSIGIGAKIGGLGQRPRIGYK